jgi:superfamily II DNA or RNA helicase
MNNSYRYYQRDADAAICSELEANHRCIVKMFCGTGKSLVMRKCNILQHKSLIVYVFPSLNLVAQYYSDYLADIPKDHLLVVSSEISSPKHPIDSTTDSNAIKQFLCQTMRKIICVTYQSYDTLLNCLEDQLIDVCVYDESHHIVGENAQQYVFQPTNKCVKQVFFTATPKNANGIIMYDRENEEQNMCGKLVYDYSYLRGLNEGYLNAFDILIDMYTENTPPSKYESIARAILETGNNRVLTFHADVNCDRDNSVRHFVDEAAFITAFEKVKKEEFASSMKYKKITMVGLYSGQESRKQGDILSKFDATPHNEIFIICSCETIGEGIDTKNANMCVFVDPKQSYVKIMQNIGRVVRKQKDTPKSSILIPCWVDREKYMACGGDREKCDEVIRQDMLDTAGNFNMILNTLSALKQEDEDIYDICLNYPNAFAPQEIRGYLESNGFEIEDDMEGTREEVMEYLLPDISSDSSDFSDSESDMDLDDSNVSFRSSSDTTQLTDNEYFEQMALKHGVCVEVHSTSLDCPVERFNEGSEEVVRLFREENSENSENIPGTFRPIVAMEGNQTHTKGKLSGPKRETKMRLNVHSNDEIKVLWNIRGGMDLTKNVCSCVIDCEVGKHDPLKAAEEIVARAREREANGERLLPRYLNNKVKLYSEKEIRENKDSQKLGSWKKALKGKGKGKCSEQVKVYLDFNLIGWRDGLELKSMKDAENIVQRAKQRVENGKQLLPRQCCHDKSKQYSEDEIQEEKDSIKIINWKLNWKKNKWFEQTRLYLDVNLPGWRDNLDSRAMQDAENIVRRAEKRKLNGKQLLPKYRCCKQTTQHSKEEMQEHQDSKKIGRWRYALKGNGTSKCPQQVEVYLDLNLPGWRDELDSKAMQTAERIVFRAKQRQMNGKQLLPRKYCKNKNKQYTECEIQEQKDAEKLGHLKKALTDKGTSKCSEQVKEYLDLNLPGWSDSLDFKAMEFAQNIVQRANQRVENGGQLLPQKCCKNKNKQYAEAEKQEHKDSQKLSQWKMALKGKNRAKCSPEVQQYLDANLPGWRDKQNFDLKAMVLAQDIVQRANQRVENGGQLLPRQCRKNKNKQYTEAEKQEDDDAHKLSYWRKALARKIRANCSPEIQQYLDENLPGWRCDETREKIKTPEKPKSMKLRLNSNKNITPTKKPAQLSTFSELNKKYIQMNAQSLNQLFQTEPQLWNEYHQIMEQSFASFPEEEIPRNQIIHRLNQLKTLRSKLVVDMGCGQAFIAQHFAATQDKRFQFINYDHIASNSLVERCDISCLPLEANCVEICILCLAMWGSKCEQYIAEAHRVLESNGMLLIVEPTKRWTSEVAEEANPADRLKSLLLNHQFRILEENIEKFAMFVCMK